MTFTNLISQQGLPNCHYLHLLQYYLLASVADPDPDPLVIWIRILLSSSKNSKKNLDSYYFVTLFDFLFLKNDVNVPSKSNMQKNCVKKLVFCWHLEGQ
jgi:hypothetical protein